MITKIKKIEQKLRLLNENLEKKVIERVNEIDKLHKHMMKVENMANLGSLVGGITHEVSTPLGIATTSSSYLLDEIKKLKEKGHKFVSDTDSLFGDKIKSGEKYGRI